MAEVDSKSKFPKRFLWGAATAAHQVEGGNHNQWTVWELENAKSLAAQSEYQIGDYGSWDRIKASAKTPGNYVSDKLADHYNRYNEDFDMLQKMNMNAFRFSIEWSRVEPSEGVWSVEAISHYKDYLTELKKRGIEPIVTLFHFTLPTWFSDKGGFEKRSNVKYFTKYVDKIVNELGASVRFIITINEPEVYAFKSYYLGNWPPMGSNLYKFWRVNCNMALAHRRSAKIIHGISRRYKVSISKNSNYFYAGDNSWLSNWSASIMQYCQDDYFIKKYIKHCDYLGVNYYQSQRVYGYRIHNPIDKNNDVEWAMSPGDIEYVLERLWEKYKKPILITENGLADNRDEWRKWWLTETLLGMKRAIKNGVQLDGYLHWSLMDNFEWAYGKWPRFGLVAIDYSTGKRSLRPSARWFGTVIKKVRGV
ncbi:MAG TPA: family 1 glycosylhydrolase [Candidatus Saccharibacteria bacterium]|nr:family 1 glycosylhydrolase [Candidatus Saccharibacteria bacterium]